MRCTFKPLSVPNHYLCFNMPHSSERPVAGIRATAVAQTVCMVLRQQCVTHSICTVSVLFGSPNLLRFILWDIFPQKISFKNQFQRQKVPKEILAPLENEKSWQRGTKPTLPACPFGPGYLGLFRRFSSIFLKKKYGCFASPSPFQGWRLLRHFFRFFEDFLRF